MNESKNSYKGVFVFLLLFACVAIVTTIWLAKKENENLNGTSGDVSISVNSSNNDKNEPIDKQKYVVKDVDGYYYSNNIEIKELKHQEGEYIKNNYSTLNVKEYDVTYFEIDGLKNEEVEKRINEEIKNAAFKVDDDKDGRSFGKVVTYEINANHSNILSFVIITKWYSGELDYWDNWYERQYFNYDLTTGNQIELEQLFTTMSIVKQEINNAAEEQFLWGEPVTEWEEYPEEYIKYVNEKLSKNYPEYLSWADPNDEFNRIVNEIEKAVEDGKIMSDDEWTSWYYRSGREEKKLKVMHAFEKGNYKYTIEDLYISIFVEDVTANIYFVPNLKNITLYNLCMTDESIFTDENSRSNKQQYKFFDGGKNKFGYLSENIFLSHSVSDYEQRYKEGYIDEWEYQSKALAERIMNEKIDAMKEYLKDDSENMYMFVDYTGTYGSDTLFIVKIDMDDFQKQQELILTLLINKFDNYSPMNETFYNFEEFENMGFEYKVYSDSIYIFEDFENNYSESHYSYRMSKNLSENLINAEKDLQWYNLNALNEAYNEIFAYHGHDFKSENLKEHFFGLIWYKPIKGKVVSLEELSDIEKQNLSIIQNKVNELKNKN